MTRRPLWLLMLLPAFFCSPEIAAQDAHFSQFFASPTTLNPALTGLFPGRYRVVVNHRNQWSKVLESAFSTSAMAADFHYDFHPKRRGSDGFGAGVLFLNDRVGEVGWSNNRVMLSGAFHKRLDARGEETLSIGVQGGIAQRSLSYDNFTFEDEFNGVNGYNADFGGELLPENSVSYGDLQLGINYSRTPAMRTAVFAGLSLHHLTRPELSFYTQEDIPDSLAVSSPLYRRFSGYVNLRIPLSQDILLSPRLYHHVQGPFAMTLLGSNVRLLMDDSQGSALHFGASLRAVSGRDGYVVNNAIAFAGLEIADFLFGLSYDIGLGDLGAAGRNRDAFEISISFIGLSEDDEAVPCPKF